TRDRDPAAWAPRVLTAEQLDRLEVLVDTILPPTDTPGASEAGVPAFVDRLLADWAESEERARVLDGLDALDELSREASGLVFLEAGDDARIALLSELDAQAVRAREAQDDPLPFFATLKEWTLTGYYTSEVGATRELQWLAMPGRWDADVPLSEVGRTWA
ncbi:MAG: gluconate 2-dehydrogenase subunit 3 family protein, partial [Longimicrobiales bacterium]|nr:gluconate 2-dehydrogenase subunit 3 family protein [Longimicrobiales bacterium]